MAEKIVMLALSPTMETGTIVKWLKKEGDHINSGDVLCEVETDKATMDYESTFDGDLLKIVADSGSQVKVGDLIAISGKQGEPVEPLLASEDGHKGNGRVSPSEAKAPEKTEHPEPQEEPRQKVKASPLAKEIARQKGIDLRTIKGSGPQGRIIKEDLEKVSPEPHRVEKPSPTVKPELRSAEERIVISDKRKVIAKRLSESMFTAPHYYVTVKVNADTFLQARSTLNSRTSTKVSVNAFLVKFVAEALKRHPVVNSSWSGDSIIFHKSIDIALAVAQKDGLITPVVKNCQEKGILTIDKELKDLVERAREGKLQYEEYTGSTFTISNLGSYGVRNFTAIINPPESAILAVGEVYEELFRNNEKEIETGKFMDITLSCDHRVIDGAVAAEFAKDLKNIIEDPITVLY